MLSSIACWYWNACQALREQHVLLLSDPRRSGLVELILQVGVGQLSEQQKDTLVRQLAVLLNVLDSDIKVQKIQAYSDIRYKGILLCQNDLWFTLPLSQLIISCKIIFPKMTKNAILLIRIYFKRLISSVVETWWSKLCRGSEVTCFVFKKSHFFCTDFLFFL